ncbi:MAG: SMP-30/gluconolactonase/LRE family protein [Candidatus Lambdaproteobacteria bacterium]|nr:SMP-30/gluconolactonase/LRE family protein [Candidatus Lambdaproteobacteria bacterium]
MPASFRCAALPPRGGHPANERSVRRQASAGARRRAPGGRGGPIRLTRSTVVNTTILADGFVFLEGPRWRGDRLWVSDMRGDTVYTVRGDGSRERMARLPNRPSGIGFLPDGTPLIVSMLDRKLMCLRGGKLAVHADLAPLVRGDINDMVVDAQGRAYIGSFGFDLHAKEKFRPAAMVMVTPDGRARIAAEELRMPNGTAITPDGRTLVVAETFGRRLSAFDIAADGALSGRRVFAELPGASPDGICMDRQGGVWVADVAQDVFVRVEDGGRITERLPVAGRAVACQLGGADGRTLFLMVAEGTMEDIAAGTTRARIETCTVAVPGSGSP